MWWQPHRYVSSPVAPPPLCPPPAFLTHKLVQNGMTAVPLHWIVLTLKWTDTFLSIKLFSPFPHSFTVPVLADQYITLSLNFRIFWNHFFCILFTFFIKWILCDVWKKANSCSLFEIVSCLCRFSCLKGVQVRSPDKAGAQYSLWKLQKMLTRCTSHFKWDLNNVLHIQIKPNTQIKLK